MKNGIVISGVLLGGTKWEVAQSQPVADDTLGDERSIVVPLESNTPGNLIEGGARRGDNLFHSLQQLNVDTGRSVYFSDPGVNNIITRVTGGNQSQIDGVLGVLGGNADLFLINPSGIIFGAKAQLDVGGSFTATTADALDFGDRGNFSATNPTAVPLLTVQPSAFVFNQINPAPIANNSSVEPQINPSGLPGFGLRVPEGEGLTLLGGNISMDGGGVNALGGRVEIGGLGAPGTVNRNADGSLSFPDGIARADVSLTNQSFIDVVADGGGSITVNAGDFEISGSFLSAGIGSNSGFVGAQAGDIILNTNTIRGGESADIVNIVGLGGIGDAGDIIITTGSLSLTDGTSLNTSILGQGNAGDVIINASENVSLDGASYIYSSIDVFTSIQAMGNAGDIRIFTSALSLTNGSQLIASALGESNAGDVIINASESVFLDSSGIFSSVGGINVNTLTVGNGGDIIITTGSLSLTNGAQLQANTLGQGNAGNVIINASESVSLNDSVIFSNVGAPESNKLAVGEGGYISITTGSLSLTNDAQLVAGTFGQGNAGNVIINASESVSLNDSVIFSSVGVTNAKIIAEGSGGDISITTGSLSLTNGAQLRANTLGQGNAGNVIIKASESVSLNDSVIFSSVGVATASTLGVGNGGDISITTGSLSLTNGAQLLANTFGQGNAGNVIIDAWDRVNVEGRAQRGVPSAIATASLSSAEGQNGNVSIAADSIRIADGAIVSADTFNRFEGGSITFNANTLEAIEGGQIITATGGTGGAGNINLDIADRITLSGVGSSNNPITEQAASGLYANTTRNSSGIGGTVQITTDNLEVFDGATIAVSSQGEGVAGDIYITANRVQLNTSSRLSAETTTVDGGNITLRDVELLQLRNGSLISTTAGTDQAGGNGGNINIDSDLIVALPNENSDIRANAFTGKGGNVFIDTQGLFGISFQAQDNPFTNDITASSEQGLQGSVNIILPDVDPQSGLTQLPEEVVDVSSRIAQGCRDSNGARLERGEFIVKGRGGLPPSPTDSLIGDESLIPWVTLAQTSSQETTITIPAPEPKTAAAPIVEAQGWIVDKNGKVTLVATAPTNAAQPHLICQRQENK
jgi:filamentous hemagglutinin family protein